MKKMLIFHSNRNALLMTICFSLFNGLIASWYSVMNITFSHLPIGKAEEKVTKASPARQSTSKVT